MKSRLLLFMLQCGIVLIGYGQAEGDYQTKGSGDWTEIAVWQRYNGSVWEDATEVPNSANAGVTTILAQHVITTHSVVSIDQLVVNGVLTTENVPETESGFLTIEDDPLTDYDFIVNGTYNLWHLIFCYGKARINGTMNCYQGIVLNQSSDAFIVDGVLNLQGGTMQGSLMINGTMNGTGVFSLSFGWATFLINGNLNADGLTIEGDATQMSVVIYSGGKLNISGIEASFFNIGINNLGEINGNGYLNTVGINTNEGGGFALGSASTIGVLKLNEYSEQGAFFELFTRIPQPFLNVKIKDGSGPGSGNDKLEINRSIQEPLPLGGILNVTEIGLVPPGNYVILSSNTGITGAFTSVLLPPDYCITYTANEVILRKATTKWYKDEDNDGYSDNITITTCDRPPGYKLQSELAGLVTDCNDNDNIEFPGQTWWIDNDGDGYGTGYSVTQCIRPEHGYIEAELTNKVGDCNDINVGINPRTVWAKDADNDGYSDGTIMIQCEQPAGFKAAVCLVATSGDCNDNNASVHPGATEICGNGIDDDCNELTSDICSVADNDNDGDPDVSDCDDNNPNIHHEATEVCNGIDDNCNGIIDENTSIIAAITPSGTQNLCSGKILTLFAGPILLGNSYVWYKNNRVIDNQTSSTLIVNSAGDYKVKITQNNCTNTSTPTTVIIVASPTASIKISGKNSNPCNGAVQLVANNVQGSYEWYKDGALQNSSGSNFNATTAGEYWVVITRNGCSTESNHIILNCPSSRATSVAAVNEISDVQKYLKVQPNPATNFLDVQWTTKNTSQTSIRILNAEGKIVKTITTQGAINNQRISLNGLAKGLYMLVLKTGADKQVSKFVIQ